MVRNEAGTSKPSSTNAARYLCADSADGESPVAMPGKVDTARAWFRTTVWALLTGSVRYGRATARWTVVKPG